MPEILPTHTPALFAEAVRRAADSLRQGKVVALPTETVYGLAANALDPAAVARIYSAKDRPARNPVIVHVADLTQARHCSSTWPDDADRLAAAFWPGPLTLVLPRADRIPDVVTGGGPTVGIRWPSHPIMQAVIAACGFPLAAPSANPANQISPTTAVHVADLLGDRVPLVIDGGPCQVGIESTVVALSAGAWRVLRPGTVATDALRAALGKPAASPGIQVADTAPHAALPSPGQMARHYAPRARVICIAWRDDADLSARLSAAGIDPGTAHVLAFHHVPAPDAAARICVIPDDPEAYARALYAEWHRCDALGAKTIVLEELPDTPAWEGLRDRVRRAMAPLP